MKKWTIMLFLVALLCSLVLTGHAAQSMLQVEDVTVKPGETVYLKVKLTGSLEGDAVGVSYTYDSEVLKPLESSSSWANQGVLQDFDAKKGAGVWAVEEAVELKGLVCTLAFQVVSEEAHFDTKVTCELKVKKDSQDVGEFTKTVTVSTYCDHKYGAWQNGSALGHTKTCENCGRSLTQSHHWDNGVTEEIDGRPGMAVTVYTCADCGATREFEHTSDAKPTAPQETEPEETNPTKPQNPTRPTNPNDYEDHTHPTYQEEDHTHPTYQEDDDHTQVTIPGFNGELPNATFPKEEHDHEHETAPTYKEEHDHDHGTEASQDEHDHDHDHTVTPIVGSKTKSRNGLIVLGVLVVLCGGAYFYVKKKR